jgi:glucose-1-phosphate adenylyltransferase
MERKDPRFVSRLTKQTLALILAGGRGSRLYELADWRAKPSVAFGGKYASSESDHLSAC